MPKGRGSNKSRGRPQKDSDQIQSALDRGAAKQFRLLLRANEVAMKRREDNPVAQAVRKHWEKSEKRKEARRRARKEWTG